MSVFLFLNHFLRTFWMKAMWWCWRGPDTRLWGASSISTTHRFVPFHKKTNVVVAVVCGRSVGSFHHKKTLALCLISLLIAKPSSPSRRFSRCVSSPPSDVFGVQSLVYGVLSCRWMRELNFGERGSLLSGRPKTALICDRLTVRGLKRWTV